MAKTNLKTLRKQPATKIKTLIESSPVSLDVTRRSKFTCVTVMSQEITPAHLSMEIDAEEEKDIINEPKITRTPKKKTQTKIEDDDVIVSSSKKRNIKGIILSVTKPSYTLKLGIGGDLGGSLRCEHRTRLRYLLRQLIRRQNWDEACGVLSILLKGTHKETSLSTNRIKYWATLELLEHMGISKSKPRKIQQVYEIWMKKDFAVTKNRRSLKGRSDVQLEFLLFCLQQQDNDAIYHSVISLLQESDFGSNPIANLVTGLGFSHLWYSAIQKEIDLHDSLESNSPIKLEMSGGRQSMLTEHSDEKSAVEVRDSDSACQQDSNTSIRIGKAIENVDRNKQISMEVKYEMKKEIPEFEEIHMELVESDLSGKSSRFPHTGDKRYGSIFYARDLEDMLMPFSFPSTNSIEDFMSLQSRIQNDHYKASVKQLRAALHSTPPVFEALLPLIQMLLFGDQVKEAIEEMESVVQNSHAALPFRLKASLLERFSNEDTNKMCICFEDTLKKDPTCNQSLKKLIALYHDGFYNIEKLVDMIALHLDATYADCNIWKEFASCFLSLSRCDEDRMSGCVDSYDNAYTKRSKYIPYMSNEDESKTSWRLRCRWWLTRHFTQTMLASEVASGNMELLVYKAASACHLYGPKFTYVVKACTYLKKEKNGEMPILKMHMENAIGFYTK